MKHFIIYHNPRCSKSRKALEILKNKGVNVTVMEYLKNQLSFDQLDELSKHFLLVDFVRKNEPSFKDLGLSIDDRESILKAMAKEPRLMQRPIIISEGKAVIGRPPERVLDLF